MARQPLITSYYGKGNHCVVTSIGSDEFATILIDDNDTDEPIPQHTFRFPVIWLPIGVKVGDALAFRFVYDSDERAAEALYEYNQSVSRRNKKAEGLV